MTLISTHSGIRGPAGELSGEVVARALARFVGAISRGGLPASLAVARDERPDGEGLGGEVVEVARSLGVDVLDLGVVATPGAKIAAARHGAGGMVVVTGSHLEPELNGLKFAIGPEFRPLDVERLPLAPGAAASARRGAVRRVGDAAELHAAAVCASVRAEAIRACGLAVGCRGGAGAGARLALSRLGCGGRAAAREPDVTFVLDADGDRLTLVDERGEAVDPEATLPLVLLARGARRIVKGADTSRAVDVLAARRGARVDVVTPGEVHLFDRLREVGGDLAGEGNGGVIVPAVGPGRDGLAAGVAILALMADSGRSVSSLAAEVPAFARARSTVRCDETSAAGAALERLARRLRVAAPPDPWGGVRVDDGSAWGLVRASATEPVIRITTEAPTPEEADELHARLAGALREEAVRA